MTDEELKKQAEANIKDIASTKATEVATKAIEDATAKQAETFASKEDVTAVKTELSQKMDNMSAEVKKQMQTSRRNVSGSIKSPRASIKAMENTFGELLSEKYDTIKSTNTLANTTKAITPDNFGSLADYNDLNNDRSLPVDFNPYDPIYLRTIFPNIGTSKTNITIWKKGAVTGGAKVWKRGTGTGGADEAKPKVQPNWVREVVSVDWIAGMTDVEAEILDDIEFVRTEIPQTLIYSEAGIMAEENRVILDYIKANAVNFTKDADFPIGVEKVIAAAFGQLGSQYLTPTHILINRWDYLSYLQFNKADGSGEYDLPGTSISFINGRLFISGLQAVPVNELEEKEAYVIASGRSRFVNRQEVRLRVSEEHNDNFEKNMITFRAEERIGFYTYDNNSFVKLTMPDITAP